MDELKALNNVEHLKLRVKANGGVAWAATQHLIGLRVGELNKAVCDFPAMLFKAETSGQWQLAVVTGLEAGKNLFVSSTAWQAGYEPLSVQTHPLCLVANPNAENQYSIGVDTSSAALSGHEGEALFNEAGKPSLYLSRMTAMLEASAKADLQTREFTMRLEELGLLRAMNVHLQYEGGTVNTLQGLCSIDEEKFAAIDNDTIVDFHRSGYLPAIYCLLTSLYQFNSLLIRYNNSKPDTKLEGIKLEVVRS